MKTTIALLLLLATSGCVTESMLATTSAGRIGCLPNDITISNRHQTLTGISWVATCKGKQFVCSDVATGSKSSEVECTEAR